MLTDLYTAILLGLSFSNIWICALVIFSLQTSDRSTGLGYISGRLLGIVGFVILFHIVGNVVKISSFSTDLISGISILLFAAYFIYKYRGSQDGHSKNFNIHKNISEKCEHNCDTCIVSKNTDVYKYCESCSDDRESCSSEDVQIEPLTRGARKLWGKNSQGEINNKGFLFGFFLGLIRGSAMCGRLVLLLPLAVKGSLISSVLVGIAFALSSTIYPVLIMFFGSYVLRAVKYRSQIVTVNSVFLIFLLKVL